MTDLAQRLVHVAAQATYGAAYGKATKQKAERAVVAVLRELAGLHQERQPDDGMSPYEMRQLADSIEKGGAE
jgi:hypothetical protein